MKKIILCLTATAFMIFGCYQPNTSFDKTKKEEKSKIVSIEDIEMQRLNSGVKKDTIIEGLVFGMNQKQVTKILNQLKKEKKVKQFAPNEDGNQILADYDIGVKDYTVYGLMDLRFYNNELFLCQIYFKENLNSVSMFTLSSDFLKLFKESLGQHQYEKSSLAGTAYIWIEGNRTLSIGSMSNPYETENDFYMIEYKENSRNNQAMKNQQENIDKKKPKI